MFCSLSKTGGFDENRGVAAGPQITGLRGALLLRPRKSMKMAGVTHAKKMSFAKSASLTTPTLRVS